MISTFLLFFSPRDISMGSFSVLLIDSVPPKTVGLLSTNGKAVCQMIATEETISVVLLYIIPFKVVIDVKSWMKSYNFENY